MSFGAYLVGVAFWMFVGAVAIAGIIADHQKRRLNVDLLRTMIERGQPLDAAVVAKLLSPEAPDERTDPEDLKLGGIITASVGVGLALLSYFMGNFRPASFYPILGGGVVTICIGAGLIIGARSMANARERERERGQSAP